MNCMGNKIAVVTRASVTMVNSSGNFLNGDRPRMNYENPGVDQPASFQDYDVVLESLPGLVCEEIDGV